MTTTVVNLKNPGTTSFYKRIDRATRWGNPHRIGPRCSRRQAVLRFISYLEDNPELVACIVPMLKGYPLACWCAPQLCHGAVLAMIAEGVPLNCCEFFI